MLDQMAGGASPADGPYPEDWLGSTVRAINPNSTKSDEGLSRVVFAGTEAVLADLVAADPIYFLGAEHVRHFGNPAQVALGQFQQQMIMIVHQHIGVQPHHEPLNHFSEQFTKVRPIPVVAINRPPLVAATGDVIYTTHPPARFAMAWPSNHPVCSIVECKDNPNDVPTS